LINYCDEEEEEEEEKNINLYCVWIELIRMVLEGEGRA